MFDFASDEADQVEGAALRQASQLIFPSRWAARTAIEHYGVDPARVHQIPCGANFEEKDIPSRARALGHSLADGIHLLWIGVDWERKGGPVAYDCLMELLDRGVNARMVMCGCVPPIRFRHPRIEVIPFLSKRDPAQRERLSQLFLAANFFVFPTQAEAFGIVLCEASGHGLPVLVRDTGGVGGAIADGENGFRLPAEATGSQYADRILAVLQDPGRYDTLVRGSRDAYEKRLNWNAWGKAVRPIFELAAQQRLELAGARDGMV